MKLFSCKECGEKAHTFINEVIEYKIYSGTIHVACVLCDTKTPTFVFDKATDGTTSKKRVVKIAQSFWNRLNSNRIKK